MDCPVISSRKLPTRGQCRHDVTWQEVARIDHRILSWSVTGHSPPHRRYPLPQQPFSLQTALQTLRHCYILRQYLEQNGFWNRTDTSFALSQYYCVRLHESEITEFSKQRKFSESERHLVVSRAPPGPQILDRWTHKLQWKLCRKMLRHINLFDFSDCKKRAKCCEIPSPQMCEL